LDTQVTAPANDDRHNRERYQINYAPANDYRSKTILIGKLNARMVARHHDPIANSCNGTDIVAFQQ